MSYLRVLQVLLILSITIGGCDFNNGKDDPPVTQILDAYANPDTVAVGDITTLSVVVRDSTKSGLVYEWDIPGFDEVTVDPRYDWVAEVAPGTYRITVEVFLPGFTSVWKHFFVTVIPDDAASKPAPPGSG